MPLTDSDRQFILDIMAELHKKRIKNNVSQQALADRIGMKQPQIAKLEMLDSVPSLKTLNRYAKGLGLKLKVTLVRA